MKRYFRCFMILSLVVLSQALIAQSGTIKGVVKDSRSGETIIGANVIIEGTTTGSSTQVDGSYTISNLSPGTYNLLVTFVSYHKQRIEDIKVERGQTIIVDILLEEDVALLEGVQVTARRVQNKDLSLISTIKASEIVVSGISAQQISRSQDSDASMVVRRIPGVTIIDGRFIMIRGLSERYNPTLIHNVSAPSMEADVRSFSFDIIPSSMLDQVLVYKSPSAELPGEFGGGVVRILTRNIPDENYVNVSYSFRFDPNTSFKSFSRPETGKFYWAGFNDGSSNLPDDFPSSLRRINDPDEITRIGRSLNNNWVTEQRTAGVNHTAAVTGGLRFNAGKAIFGNTTSLTYFNTMSLMDVERVDYNNYSEELEVSSPIFNFNDRQNNQRIRSGLLHNWGVSLNPNHTIEFLNLFNQIAHTQYVYRTGPHHEFNYFADNHSYHQAYRGIYTGQLIGRHKALNEQLNIEWVGGYTHAYRDEPDYRRYRSDLDTITEDLSLFIPFGAAQTYFMGRFYSDMKENTYTAGLNLKYRLKFENRPFFEPEISAGLYYEDKDRSFFARNLGYVRAISEQFDQGLRFVSIDSLFHVDNINYTTGIKIDEQTNPSDSYTASSHLLAGYAQISVPITNSIRFNAGLRVEDYQLIFNSATLTNDPVMVDRSNLSILPSVYLGYNISEKMLVRFAYGKTVNRPEFRELAPFGFYDFNYNFVKKGNPELGSATIHNYDIRWEWYPTPTEIIMAGVFYKKFLSPIESSFVPGAGTAGSKIFTYENADYANSIGIELEARKSLAVLTNSAFIDKLYIVFNAALIASHVELGDAALGQAYTDRPMQGQSPYIVNAGLFYIDYERRLQLNLLYNVIGKRIFMIGYDDYPEIYEMPRNLIEFNLSKGFSDKFEFKFGIRDILTQDFLLLQDGNQDAIFDPKVDQNIERMSPTPTFSFGFTYKF